MAVDVPSEEGWAGAAGMETPLGTLNCTQNLRRSIGDSEAWGRRKIIGVWRLPR